MERIVALVEGHTETHFVKTAYPNAIVQRPFPNGDDVSLDLIVECINDRLETVGNDIKRVMILLDRERRSLSAEDMSAYLMAGVATANSHRTFYIGVSDREIENWVISDEANIKTLYNVHNYEYPGDGCGGKSRMKQITEVDLSYRDKAHILRSNYCSRMRAKSNSLAAFVAKIDFPWWWAER